MIHPEVASLNVIFLECLIGSAIFWFVSHIIKRKVNQIELDHSYMEKTILEVEDNLQTKEGSGGTSKGITTVKHKNQKEDESSTSFGTKIFGSMKNLTRKPIEARERSLVKLTVGKGETCGRRAKGQSSSSRGRYAWYQTPKGKPKDIALVPTIQAAAIHQKGRENLIPRTLIKPEDIRIKVREYYAPFTLVLLIDMSLSMANSMENIIETIYSFHRDVYRRKDRVALIVFKGIKSHIIQQPTRNLDLVVEKLRKVGASDFTPMATGLLQSLKILKQERIINKDSIPNVIVVSDGIVNVPLDVPLSPLTRRKYLSEAQADALDVAFLMSKEKIKVHIVNTNHSEIDAKSFPVTNFGNRIRFTPTQFMMELARLTGGEYKGLTSASED
jgi:Mg-chelatase subunit ChlD